MQSPPLPPKDPSLRASIEARRLSDAVTQPLNIHSPPSSSSHQHQQPLRHLPQPPIQSTEQSVQPQPQPNRLPQPPAPLEPSSQQARSPSPSRLMSQSNARYASVPASAPGQDRPRPLSNSNPGGQSTPTSPLVHPSRPSVSSSYHTDMSNSASGSNESGGERAPFVSNARPAGMAPNRRSIGPTTHALGPNADMAKGAVGGEYGPYSHIAQSSVGSMSNGVRGAGAGLGPRPHPNPNRRSGVPPAAATGVAVATGASLGSNLGSEFRAPSRSGAMSSMSTYSDYPSSPTPQPSSPPVDLLWDAKDSEMDDFLHNPDPAGKKDGCIMWSGRGILNVLAMSTLILALLLLFAGYPVISHYTRLSVGNKGGFNIGGTNGSGQVPDIPNLAALIDPDTPPSAQKFVSPNTGTHMHVVFSDEFEVEGRTFWPGDDPYWEAVDIWYGATGDYEWYSPEAINTTDGALVIELTEKATHNLNFQSGMLQSWNKFCFQGGYIEFAAMLPGAVGARGYWPGLWLFGNLGRPGYLGSTDGMWPYSYQSCDVGILPNQTYVNGTGPPAALRATAAFSDQYDNKLSFLNGMRTSACTCNGEDHPGPNNRVGRSAPELDILEAQVYQRQGQASQSMQTAPFDPNYDYSQSKTDTHFYQPQNTMFNSYTGGAYQEAVSALTLIPDKAYALAPNAQYVTFGMEYSPDWDANGNGYVVWYIDGKETWRLEGSAIGPRTETKIGQRTIPTEPMAIVLNLGISKGFQTVFWDELTFPASMKVDYVRVYQPDGQKDLISCDPPDWPTSDYITRHPDIYYNPNHTVYPRDQPGYSWPKNQQSNPGCSSS